MHFRIRACALVLLAALLPAAAAVAQLTPLEQLGKDLYFDSNLSNPNKMSCSSCHLPTAGYADPDATVPTSLGVIDARYGNRNSPSSAYAAFAPLFQYDAVAMVYFGGQFWDGRAPALEDQAKGPFLNPLEMANPNQTSVVTDVIRSTYGDLFRLLIGKTNSAIMADVPGAYDFIAGAIATYERSGELNKFNSKYDANLAGAAALTAAEQRGLALFEGRAKCSLCHPARPAADGTPPLLTAWVYHNLGVPKNPDNLFYTVPKTFNPDGAAYVDYGLGGRLGEADQMGKFKTMTLRNIAVTAPYMHNGAFATLDQVVDFMNSRDLGGWPAPEVPANVSTVIGNLGLSPTDVQDIVAFLNTLTDDYAPPVAPLASAVSQPGFTLEQNRPNPFNPATEIRFNLTEPAYVKLDVFDVQGRRVATLFEGDCAAGSRAYRWDAGNGDQRAASGLYFYRLQAGKAVVTRSMLLVK
ncbi:MAG: cytochrome c peroxidase [Candidatus Krumholzibacteriia bacterium]